MGTCEQHDGRSRLKDEEEMSKFTNSSTSLPPPALQSTDDNLWSDAGGRINR
jgi:hypothetical protein